MTDDQRAIVALLHQTLQAVVDYADAATELERLLEARAAGRTLRRDEATTALRGLQLINGAMADARSTLHMLVIAIEQEFDSKRSE